MNHNKAIPTFADSIMDLSSLPDPLPVPILNAERGDWTINTFDLTENDVRLNNLRAEIKGDREMLIKPGRYTKLEHRHRGLVMSNTPMEVQTNLPFIRAAKGRVLINGLGLGMVLRAVLEKPEVEHVTVHEIDPDVIAMVAPGFAADITTGRLLIKQEDCFAYKPQRGESYDVAWHDVWDTISKANLRGMAKLNRKWARRIRMQLCWARRMCEQSYY